MTKILVMKATFSNQSGQIFGNSMANFLVNVGPIFWSRQMKDQNFGT